MSMVLQWSLVHMMGLSISWSPAAPPEAGEGAEGIAAGAPAPTPAETSVTKRGHVRWIGSLGATGAAMAVAGVSGVTVGLVFIRRGVTVEPDPADDSVNLVRDFSRPGWVIYGASFGVTALGAIALAIDVTAGRERRYRRMVVQPQLGRTHAGLQLDGRF